LPINKFPEDHLISRVYSALSLERLGTYLKAAGHDPERALQLYMWNAQIGEAFHVPIQAVEIALRNRISLALTDQFGRDWWRSQPFLDVVDDERRRDLDEAQRRIQYRGLTLGTPQIVASLSLGFWVGLLQPHYNPTIWGAQLRTAFPALPKGRARKSLAKSASRTAYLRNRIWHHEPIFKEDLSRDFATVMELLRWICPDTAAWIRPHCRVPDLLRQKP